MALMLHMNATVDNLYHLTIFLRAKINQRHVK